MSVAILVRNLRKTFLSSRIEKGFFNVLKNLFSPTTYEIHAIDDLSFTVNRGEKVAFIGPNGAGKSTTIKILTGILYPTAGEIQVLGLIPYKNRYDLSFHIGCVFGQRSQLWFHLPPIDTFHLLSKIYELNASDYKKRLDELIQIFELERLLYKPIKQLSLGERMRCELVASLLHKPDILFLDEPTIGLDLNAKLEIRTLLNRLSHEHKTTLFLTSHDTQDIEQVTDRVLILDKGSLIIDSTLNNLKKSYFKKKRLTLITEETSPMLIMQGVEICTTSAHNLVCEIDLSMSSIEKVLQEAFSRLHVKDVTIEDPSMEEIIRDVYASKKIR